MSGLELPRMMNQPTMAISAPFNDIQLIAIIAANRHQQKPEDAVEWAIEVLAHAVVKAGQLQKRVEELREAQ